MPDNATTSRLARRWPGRRPTTSGLARHPGHDELTQLRQQALHRLMERHQLQDPFRFLIYADMAGAEIGPAA